MIRPAQRHSVGIYCVIAVGDEESGRIREVIMAGRRRCFWMCLLYFFFFFFFVTATGIEYDMSTWPVVYLGRLAKPLAVMVCAVI